MGDARPVPGTAGCFPGGDPREARGRGGWQGKPVGGLGPVTQPREQESTEQRIRLWMERLNREQGIQFTPRGTLDKMREEWQEFLDDPDDEMELADLVITCIAHAQTRGWRLGVAISEKMKINEARTWVSQPDGTIHHE